MDELSEALHAAPRQAEPRRDLWPGVESRIRESHTGRWLRAAAAIVLFSAGTLTGVLVERGSWPHEASSPDTLALHRVAVVQRAGSEYVAAVARLRDLGAGDEALRAQGYEAALGVVSVTAQEVTAALDLRDGGMLVGRARAVHAAVSQRTTGMLQGRGGN